LADDLVFAIAGARRDAGRISQCGSILLPDKDLCKQVPGAQWPHGPTIIRANVEELR
jgi:hypothetical protein